jgi:hypothetical protein
MHEGLVGRLTLFLGACTNKAMQDSTHCMLRILSKRPNAEAEGLKSEMGVQIKQHCCWARLLPGTTSFGCAAILTGESLAGAYDVDFCTRGMQPTLRLALSI